MSRNRCSIDCRCGTELPLRVSLEDMVDEAETYPYSDERLVGYSHDIGGYSPDKDAFQKLVCPICKTPYLGWYKFQLSYWPDIGGDPYWFLYDTSYYHSHRDEPSKRDDAESIYRPVEELYLIATEWERINVPSNKDPEGDERE